MRYRLIALAVILSAISALSVPAMGAKTDDGWSITNSDFEATYRALPLANGKLGIMPGRDPFAIRHVMLGGVYDLQENGGHSSTFKNFNPFSMRVQVNGETLNKSNISDWSQTMDLKRATLISEFRMGHQAEFRYEVRALRSMPYAGLISIEVKALKEDITIDFNNRIRGSLSQRDSLSTMQWVAGSQYEIDRVEGYAPQRLLKQAAAECVFTDEGPMPQELTLKRGESARFYVAGSVVSGTDFMDPGNEAVREITIIIGETAGKMISRHEAEWAELWQGDIEIEGDPQAQRLARVALYNLYSSIRKGDSSAIPPFGFSRTTSYSGHIFWDSELWMYPPMLFLNQDIARSMVQYRIDRLPGARRKAYSNGYAGAMFPWESNSEGEEGCPPSALTGAFEHHISACVALGIWNYYRMTGDKWWLENEGWPLLREVATFWVSRSTQNLDGSYSILNVVCADEYAEGVDDNAFTNGAVKCALQAATRAAEICHKPSDPRWAAIADGLRITQKGGVTQEYASYDGRNIKQTDVNLLAYPLQVITDEGAIRRDLEYYESRIVPEAPAMSYAIFAIEWARLLDRDRTDELWRKTIDGHLHGPWLAISEVAGDDGTCFMTGYGGILQAMINGFCGLELTDEGIKQVPSTMPKGWKSITVRGVGPDRLTFKNTVR